MMGRFIEYRPVAFASLVCLTAILFVSGPSYVHLSLTASITALLALSLGLAFGQGGLLSAAQAAFAGVGAYATAIMTTRWDLNPWLGLVAAVLLSSFTAWLLARMVVRLSPIALALATVTFSQILAQVLSQGGDFTGGFVGLSGIPRVLGMESMYIQQVFGWIMVVLISIMYVRVCNSMQGRAYRAIRYDATLAKSLGIPVPTRLASLFALSGGIAGLAGWLHAHQASYLAPESLPILLSITVLMVVVIGGTRTVAGPVVGAVLLTIFQNYLPGDEMQNIVLGSILLVFIFVAPNGLSALPWGRAFRSRQSAASGPSGPRAGAIQEEESAEPELTAALDGKQYARDLT